MFTSRWARVLWDVSLADLSDVEPPQCPDFFEDCDDAWSAGWWMNSNRSLTLAMDGMQTCKDVLS